jgi:hypothetical protein
MFLSSNMIDVNVFINEHLWAFLTVDRLATCPAPILKPLVPFVG